MMKLTNDGISNYNAFQLTVEHRFSQGLSFVANYTFSKTLDNESVEAQLTVTNPNPFNPRTPRLIFLFIMERRLW